METNCIYCETSLPARAYFCSKCHKQVKCRSCNEELEPAANICVMCGTEVINKMVTAQMNTIEFSENRSGRSFKASFTDTIGHHIGDTFSSFLNNKIGLKPGKAGAINSDEDLQEADFNDENTEAVLLEEGDELKVFKNVFKADGEKVSLIQPKLKANNKMNYSQRLTCLYLYYKQLMGIDKVPRNEVTAIVSQASVYDGNYRRWIAAESTLLRLSGEEIEILLPGIEFAKEVIAEMKDVNVQEKWKLGTTRKPSKRKPTKNDTSETDE